MQISNTENTEQAAIDTCLAGFIPAYRMAAGHEFPLSLGALAAQCCDMAKTDGTVTQQATTTAHSPRLDIREHHNLKMEGSVYHYPRLYTWRPRQELRCYNCSCHGHVAVRCPTGRPRDIQPRDMFACNYADDLGNTECIYSHVEVVHRYITVCMDMGSDISLVRRYFLPHRAKKIRSNTQITSAGVIRFNGKTFELCQCERSMQCSKQDWWWWIFFAVSAR